MKYNIFSTKSTPCNYYCKICRKTENKPNILGRFILQHLTNNYLCTGCRNEFTKEELRKIATQDIIYVERILF